MEQKAPVENQVAKNEKLESTEDKEIQQPKKKIKTTNENTTITIPFGKHKGVLFDNLPFSYILFLSGKRMYGIRCINDDVKDRVESIWLNRDSIRKNCFCGMHKGIGSSNHNSDCHGYVLGNSFEDTYTNFEELALSKDKNIFKDAKICSAFIWVKMNHPQVVEYAQNYINEKNLCWQCGTRLVPIGSARQNGASHNDWQDRHLHKNCFKSLNNEN